MAALVESLAHRRSVAVLVILVINILVLVAMELSGGSTKLTVLTNFGAKVNSLIDAGQVWRLVTCTFLHIGFLHLLFNSLALWSFGRDLEKLYGTVKFVLIYLVSGIAGSGASYLLAPRAVSAGASGAIFGLIGLSLVFGYRYRSSIPPQLKSRFGSGILPLLFYNVMLGIRPRSGIDIYAHLGGLAAGIILGFIVPASIRPGEDDIVPPPPPSTYT
jgi:rhomboid protease GluP